MGRDWMGDDMPSCELNVVKMIILFMAIHINIQWMY